MSALVLFMFQWWHIALCTGAVAIIGLFLRDDRKLEYDADYGTGFGVLSRWNKGFVIDGTRRLSRVDSYRNVMVCGSVGSYKSSATAIPFLREVDNALLLVNDISGELLTESYSELRQKGYNIKILKLRDPDDSNGFNPLARCNTSGQINRVATSIVESNMKGSGDPFWSKSAVGLVSTFILMLKAHGYQYANLPNLLRCLKVFQSDPEKIDPLFLKTSDEIFQSYKTIVKTSDRTLSGIVSTAIASLQLVDDHDVARVVSHDTLGDFNGMRKTKTAIFVQNSVLDIDYLRFVTDIFFEQFIEAIMSRSPEKDDSDIYMVLDEFASSMKINNAGRIFSTLRKYRCGVLGITQNGKSQLQQNYSAFEAETIVSNCATKVWLAGGLDLETARRLERVGGRFEGIDEDGRKKSRQLITESEALLIPSKQGIMEMSGHPLVKLRLTPHFERLKYAFRKREPINICGGVPEEIPLIPIEK